MTKREWSDLVFEIYKEFRESKGWPDIYECHDREDQLYFMGLDDIYGR